MLSFYRISKSAVYAHNSSVTIATLGRATSFCTKEALVLLKICGVLWYYLPLLGESFDSSYTFSSITVKADAGETDGMQTDAQWASAL